ncbi:hypothetical protein ABE425_14745 [Chryseobacterium cucumeris]|uniref:hypothetical protein n=1 Tax=Chryseobacterium TaxID=59732 RepID=UPI00288302AF|nr:hypothetical protein [Chryseobacterium sp. SG20098]WNI34742.1 hypothetical protein RHP76_12210 [Chryseobacterium sp. SG20098]
MEEKKIKIMGLGLSAVSIAATLPKSIQVIATDLEQERKKVEDAGIRSINKLNQSAIEDTFNSLSNIYIPHKSHVSTVKHRLGNNSKRPKPRKKKRK